MRIFVIFAMVTAVTSQNKGIWEILDNIGKALQLKDVPTPSPTAKPTEQFGEILGDILDKFEEVWNPKDSKSTSHPRTMIEKILDGSNVIKTKNTIQKPILRWQIKQLMKRFKGLKAMAKKAMKMAKKALEKARKAGKKEELAKKMVKKARNAKAMKVAKKKAEKAIKMAQNAMKKYQEKNKKAQDLEKLVDMLMKSIQELLTKNGGAKKRWSKLLK
jgi:hypothetical protein